MCFLILYYDYTYIVQLVYLQLWCVWRVVVINWFQCYIMSIDCIENMLKSVIKPKYTHCFLFTFLQKRNIFKGLHFNFRTRMYQFYVQYSFSCIVFSNYFISLYISNTTPPFEHISDKHLPLNIYYKYLSLFIITSQYIYHLL